jgi:hypothetical protein
VHDFKVPHHRIALAAAGVIWVAALAAAPYARQAPANRPMIPMAASSIVRNPDAYVGQNVSVMAAVEALVSKTAFTIDQDRNRSTGQEVLVLAPNLNTAPTLNAYVTVQGEVFKFDPAEVARRAKTYQLDLPADVAAKFAGKPAILATAVISPQLVDLAKRVLPPPTAAELALDQAMKTISPTFNDLRTGLETPKAEVVKEQLTALKGAFTTTESFFKARGTADATGWAAEALKFVGTMEQAAAGARWDDVRAAATGLGGLCQQCHIHRERQDDGSYRVKGEGASLR